MENINKEILTKENINFEDLKRDFINLLMGTKRNGIENLMKFIEEKSDFFTAPASTRFHGNFEGGLLLHSMKVYEILIEKCYLQDNRERLKNLKIDSFVIVGLLHDICKINYYQKSFKNVKNEKTGNWEKQEIYTVNDTIPYGHGEKSVMILSEYIKLNADEKYAIRWHMGFSEPKENYNSLSLAYSKYPLCLLLSEADLEATYFLNI